MPYPLSEMLYVWKLQLKNQPHDSICGCSVDEVHREMMQRWQKLHQAVNALDARAFEWIYGQAALPVVQSAKTADPPGIEHNPRLAIGRSIVAAPEYHVDKVAVFNLSSEPVSCPVLVEWSEDLQNGDASTGSQRTSSDDVQIVTKEREPLIFSGTGREPDVRVVDRYQAWLWAQNVPAFGVRSIPFNDNAGRSAKNSGKWSTLKTASPVSVESRRMSNGLLSVEITKTGEVIVIEHSENGEVTYNLEHKIRDTGDGGDTYNNDPLVDDDPITAALTEVKPWQRGPLVGSLQVTYEIEIPASLTDRGEHSQNELRKFTRSSRLASHTITTEISLRRGLPVVFFDTRWVNHSNDHRLEVVVNTGSPVRESYSENHFSTITRSHKPLERPLPVDKGCEAPLDRYPCQRFFIANGQLILNKGLPEYGVEGNDVSVTVLRAVSRLSRPRLMTRGGGAGPAVATPEANCLGLNEVSYGWAPLSQLGLDEQLVEAYRLSELFTGCTLAVPFAGEAMPHSDWLLSCDNSAVRVMALYMDDNDRTVVRLLNVTPHQLKVRVEVNLECFADLPPRLQLINLDGAVLSTLEGTCAPLLPLDRDKSAGPAEQTAARTAADRRACQFEVHFGANQLISLALAAASSAHLT